MTQPTLTWTTTLQAIDGSDDLLLPIPDDVLAHMGWHIGDDLCVTVTEGDYPAVIITKMSNAGRTG